MSKINQEEHESEETEVKKQRLIKNIKSLARETSQRWPHEEMVELPDVLREIDELDEPEVFSQKWIKDNTFYNSYVSKGGFIFVDDLLEVIVPKQEEVTKEALEKYGMSELRWKEVIERYKWHLEHEGYVVTQKPIIPEFVFEDIKGYKDAGMVEIGELFSDIFDEKRMATNLYKTSEWAINNQVEFAKAWLAYPNVEVEEEQKYRVVIGNYVLRKSNNSDRFQMVLKNSPKENTWSGCKIELTEKEILALNKGDIYFEHFAVPVKEDE